LAGDADARGAWLFFSFIVIVPGLFPGELQRNSAGVFAGNARMGDDSRREPTTATW